MDLATYLGIQMTPVYPATYTQQENQGAKANSTVVNSGKSSASDIIEFQSRDSHRNGHSSVSFNQSDISKIYNINFPGPKAQMKTRN